MYSRTRFQAGSRKAKFNQKDQLWAAPSGLGFMARKQRRGYQSGEALIGHINTHHGGMVSSTCRACAELQRKTEAAQCQN